VSREDAPLDGEQQPGEVPDGTVQFPVPQDIPAYTVQAGLATAHGASPDFQGNGEEE
jgi:hypothetical protein